MPEKAGSLEDVEYNAEEQASAAAIWRNLLPSQSPMQRIDELAARAAKQAGIGDPRLAHSMDNEEWMALDEWRKLQFRAQKESDWNAMAEKMIAPDYEGTLKGIMAKTAAREKIQAAIQRNTLRSQALSPGATLSQDLTRQPDEQQSSRDRITRNPPSQRALDTQQGGIAGPESDPARTAPLTGKSKAAFDAAIAQARPAFAALGSDISLSDQALPAGLGISWARYSPAQKRAYFHPNSAPAAATPSLVRAYIREELIHAAQFAVAEREYRRDPKGAQNPEDYLARTHAAISRDLAATPEGRQLLLASISAYRGGIAPEVLGTPKIAVSIAEKNPS